MKNNKLIIGMVHLPPLPGSPNFNDDKNLNKTLKSVESDIKSLQEKISNMPGVLEVGIFTRKPDIIYKARSAGKFDVIK